MPSFRTSDQVKVHYEVLGAPSTRPPLVLIHGFPMTRALWSGITPALLSHGQVVLADLRGFGASDIPAGPYTMERHARDMAELLQSLGLRHAFVVGHSMGGYVALALAELFPDMVQGLGLASSHPFADDEKGREGRYAAAEKVLTGDRSGWNHEMVGKMLADDAADEAIGQIEVMVQGQDSRAVAAALVGMALRPDRQQVWRQFVGASLFIGGTRDKFIPPARVAHIKDLRPSAQICLLDTAHVGMVEKQGEFTEVLLDWWMPFHNAS